MIFPRECTCPISLIILEVLPINWQFLTEGKQHSLAFLTAKSYNNTRMKTGLSLALSILMSDLSQKCNNLHSSERSCSEYIKPRGKLKYNFLYFLKTSVLLPNCKLAGLHKIRAPYCHIHLTLMINHFITYTAVHIFHMSCHSATSCLLNIN